MKIKISYSDLNAIHDCLVIGAGYRAQRIRELKLHESPDPADKAALSIHEGELQRVHKLTNLVETMLQGSDLFCCDYELIELREEVKNGNYFHNKRIS